MCLFAPCFKIVCEKPYIYIIFILFQIYILCSLYQLSPQWNQQCSSMTSVQVGRYGQAHDDSWSAFTMVSVQRPRCFERKSGFKLFKLAWFSTYRSGLHSLTAWGGFWHMSNLAWCTITDRFCIWFTMLKSLNLICKHRQLKVESTKYTFKFKYVGLLI